MPNNESAWNYLTGLENLLLFHFKIYYVLILMLVLSILEKGRASKENGLRNIIFRWIEDGMDSPYLLSFAIDIYEEDLESGNCSNEIFEKAQEVESNYYC